MATLLLGLGSQGVPLGTTDTALGSGRARRSTENTFDPGYEGLTYAQVAERTHPKVTYISTSGIDNHSAKYGAAPFLSKLYEHKWKPGDKGMRCHAVDKEHDTDPTATALRCKVGAEGAKGAVRPDVLLVRRRHGQIQGRLHAR